MTYDEFLASIENDPAPPDGLEPALQALWHTRKGQWERAHDVVNDLPSAIGSWIHAHLHRIEGDLGNAAYWYSRAGKPAITSRTGLDEEWVRLVKETLG